MKTVPSSRFRNLYAVLNEPTVVTALGRPIGLWLPGPNAGIEQIADEALIEEIAHLKRELAKRPPVDPIEETWREGLKDPVATHTGFVDRATGDISLIPGRMSEDRRSRQKVIDEALRKVNRTTKEKKP